MSSFENVRPGMSPRFLSQKMAANEPEKKIPSTAAKATTRTEYGASEPIHFKAHSAKITLVKYKMTRIFTFFGNSGHGFDSVEKG